MSSLFAQRIGKAAGRMAVAVVLTGAGTILEEYVRDFKKVSVNGFKDDAKQAKNLVNNKAAGREPDDYDLI